MSRPLRSLRPFPIGSSVTGDVPTKPPYAPWPSSGFVRATTTAHLGVTRRGYAFRHFIAPRADPKAEARAQADQLERFLISGLAEGMRYTRNTLDDAGVMKPRDKLRKALSDLVAAGRVVDVPNPTTAHTRGGAHTYLHPVAFASPSPDGEATENDDENDDSLRRPDPPFGSPPPYRGKNGGEAKPPPFPPSPPRFAGEAPRSNGEASEANDVGDILDHGPEDLGGHGDADPDLVEGSL